MVPNYIVVNFCVDHSIQKPGLYEAISIRNHCFFGGNISRVDYEEALNVQLYDPAYTPFFDG